MTYLDTLPLWNECKDRKWITDVVAISSRYVTMHRFLCYVIRGESVSDLGFTLVDDMIHILYLQTEKPHRGKGYAGKLLRLFVEYADEIDMPLKLIACPHGKTGLSEAALGDFYYRHGFTSLYRGPSGHDYMLRQPLRQGIAS